MSEVNVKPIEELTFREAMDELDKSVAVLDSHSAELEDAIAAYERSVKLFANLQDRLSAAQQKVEVLMGDFVVPADDATTDTTLS